MKASENIQVIKKDGRTEPFQASKIRGSLIYAGAKCEQAESITKQVELSVVRSAKERKISTKQIRDKVIKLLREKNKEAADAYEFYKKE